MGTGGPGISSFPIREDGAGREPDPRFEGKNPKKGSGGNIAPENKAPDPGEFNLVHDPDLTASRAGTTSAINRNLRGEGSQPSWE